METRNTSSTMELMELKLESFKSSITSDLKSDLSEIKKLIKDQSELITELKQTITQHDSTISVLQTGIKALKDENDCYKKKLAALDAKYESLEQYTRRQSLRVDGVEISRNETSDKIVTVVENLMKEVGMQVSPLHIDKAHKIGPKYYNNGKKFQSIIVKFVNFRTRTEFYQKRKQIKNDIRLRIDLTKGNYNLLKEITAMIYENKLVDVYVFADINCRIKVVDKSSDESCFVNSVEDFKNFISHASASSVDQEECMNE